MTDLEHYNALAQALLVPFEDSEIEKREGGGGKTFSYVPPERYRRRLLSVFDEGFVLNMEDVKVEKSGIWGSCHFKGGKAEDNVYYDLRCFVFESWTFGAKFLWNNETKKRDLPNPDAGKILNPEYTFMALDSAGMKAVSRAMGLGLHLYDKGPSVASQTANRATASRPAAAAATGAPASGGGGVPNFDPEWDGSETCTIGTKIKGEPWANAEDGYLEFLTRDPEKANRSALKEIARRQASAGQSGKANAEAAMASKPGASDEEDFTF